MMQTECKAKIEYDSLVPVSFKEIWGQETDFSYDLANDPRLLSLLGNALNFDLALEQTEAAVGTFRADIVCKDRNTGQRVVIENQRGWTDHDHLGKLITYGPGLNANYLVWAAEDFNEKNLAALRWLNEKTDSSINVFAVKVELWRFANWTKPHPPAIKFTVLCQPNDWSRRSAQDKNLTFYEDFWLRLKNSLMLKNPDERFLKDPKLTSDHYYYMSYGVGLSGAKFAVALDFKARAIRITLELEKEQAKRRFDWLKAQSQDLESEIQYPLQWDPGDGRIKADVYLFHDELDFTSEAGVDAAVDWTSEQLIRFHTAIYSRLEDLRQV